MQARASTQCDIPFTSCLRHDMQASACFLGIPLHAPACVYQLLDHTCLKAARILLMLAEQIIPSTTSKCHHNLRPHCLLPVPASSCARASKSDRHVLAAPGGSASSSSASAWFQAKLRPLAPQSASAMAAAGGGVSAAGILGFGAFRVLRNQVLDRPVCFKHHGSSHTPLRRK